MSLSISEAVTPPISVVSFPVTVLMGYPRLCRVAPKSKILDPSKLSLIEHVIADTVGSEDQTFEPEPVVRQTITKSIRDIYESLVLRKTTEATPSRTPEFT